MNDKKSSLFSLLSKFMLVAILLLVAVQGSFSLRTATPSDVSTGINQEHPAEISSNSFHHKTFHFCKKQEENSSEDYIFVEESEDDELKEKIATKLNCICKLFLDLPLSLNLSERDNAYYASCNFKKSPVELYVLYHSWKHFIA